MAKMGMRESVYQHVCVCGEIKSLRPGSGQVDDTRCGHWLLLFFVVVVVVVVEKN